MSHSSTPSITVRGTRYIAVYADRDGHCEGCAAQRNALRLCQELRAKAECSGSRGDPDVIFKEVD